MRERSVDFFNYELARNKRELFLGKITSLVFSLGISQFLAGTQFFCLIYRRQNGLIDSTTRCGSQVVRPRFAKPPFVGSIPTRTSNLKTVPAKIISRERFFLSRERRFQIILFRV